MNQHLGAVFAAGRVVHSRVSHPPDLGANLTFLRLNPLTKASRDWVYCSRCHNKVYRYRLWLQARKIAILRD